MYRYILSKSLSPSVFSLISSRAERIDHIPLMLRYDYLINQPPSRIKRIYLGNIRHSADLSLLKKLNVTTVVNCTADQPNYFEKDFRYIRMPIHDQNYNVLDSVFLNKLATKIKNKPREVFFIHCFEGSSRSCAVVCAYIMLANNWTWERAYDYIKKRRPIVNLNKKFIVGLENLLN